MFSRELPLCRLALLGVALGVSPAAMAQLAAKSPFLPATAAGAAAVAASAPLEYKGYMETSEGRLFRLYDPAKKVRVWVRLNERNQEFDVVVKQHDSVRGTLTIEHQGKVFSLEEPKSKVVSAGAPPPVMPPPMPSTVPAAVTQAVVLNPSPADEARRLDAVAAEVQRRRALREQAAQQITPGANTPMTLPAPVPPQAQPQGNFQPGMPRTIRPLNEAEGQRFQGRGAPAVQPR